MVSFSCLLVLWLMLSARARVLVQVIILGMPARLARLNSLLSSSVLYCLSSSPVVVPLPVSLVSLRTLERSSQRAVFIRRIRVDTLGVTCNLEGIPVPNRTLRWSYSVLDSLTGESSHVNHVVCSWVVLPLQWLRDLWLMLGAIGCVCVLVSLSASACLCFRGFAFGYGVLARAH